MRSLAAHPACREWKHSDETASWGAANTFGEIAGMVGQESLSARLRRLYPPMSDAEFRARYDPQSVRDDALLEILREIKNVLVTLDNPPSRNQSYQSFKPPTNAKPTGPMPL